MRSLHALKFWNKAFSLLVAIALTAPWLATANAATFFFDANTPYLSQANIPTGFYAGETPTFLDDFEDGTLDGSIIASFGIVIAVSQSGDIVDSVDGDDGVIDGAGNTGGNGHTFFGGDPSFNFGALGTLPTAAGLVWTDGGFAGAITTFEAFDANEQSLGTVVVNSLGDNSFSGTVEEDRFFGVQHASGILRIAIRASFENIEIDHLQYGFALNPVPLPAGVWLLLSALGLFGVRRRITV